MRNLYSTFADSSQNEFFQTAYLQLGAYHLVDSARGNYTKMITSETFPRHKNSVSGEKLLEKVVIVVNTVLWNIMIFKRILPFETLVATQKLHVYQ